MSDSFSGKSRGITRRDFMKAAAAGTAGLSFIGLPSGKSDAMEKYPHWGEAFEAGVTFALKNHVGSAGNNIKYRQKLFHLPPEDGNRIHQLAGRGQPIAERIALVNTAPDIKNKTRYKTEEGLKEGISFARYIANRIP